MVCNLFPKVIFALLILLAGSSARADDATPNFAQEKLTGDWGGARTDLYNHGISFDMYYKVDLWRNFAGGVEKGSRWDDNLDLMMTVDGGKTAHLEGMTLFIYLLNNDGQRPNELTGSGSGIDNIEVAVPAFRLYEAWLEQTALSGRLSVRAGLYDLNTEFYATDNSGMFLNPTFGIGTEMGATGDTGPSIFPVTSPALRVAAKPFGNTYVQAAVLDGVPGDPSDPRGTHVHLGGKEGALSVAEAGYRSDDIGHYGFGAWEYTARRPELGVPGVEKHSRGMYFMAERALYRDGARNLGGFLRAGCTAGNVEQFKSSWSAGIVLNGFVKNRPDGKFGLALSGDENSDKFRSANAPLGSRETNVELTYQDKVTPAITLQPDLQYIVDPGAVPGVRNAVAGAIRMGVDF